MQVVAGWFACNGLSVCWPALFQARVCHEPSRQMRVSSRCCAIASKQQSGSAIRALRRVGACPAAVPGHDEISAKSNEVKAKMQVGIGQYRRTLPHFAEVSPQHFTTQVLTSAGPVPRIHIRSGKVDRQGPTWHHSTLNASQADKSPMMGQRVLCGTPWDMGMEQGLAHGLCPPA